SPDGTTAHADANARTTTTDRQRGTARCMAHSGQRVGGSGREELGTVAGLGRLTGDRPTARDALAGRELAVMLDVGDEEVERALRVGLDDLELRERALERLDVIAVLDLVQPVLGPAAAAVAADQRLVRPRAALDRQQRVHRAGHRDQRPPDLPGGRDL